MTNHCENCQRVFADASNLRRHMKSVCGSHKFACVCGSEFARKDSLKRHKQKCKAQERVDQIQADLEAKPSTIIVNNISINQLISNGLVNHVTEQMIFDAIQNEIDLAQDSSILDSLSSVQKLVGNALIGKVSSSNMRHPNFVYNKHGSLVDRDINSENEVTIGTKRALKTKGEARYNRLMKNPLKNKVKINNINNWYSALTKQPNLFYSKIAQGLHRKNYIENGKYVDPPRLSYL